jgi:hypothetical protein
MICEGEKVWIVPNPGGDLHPAIVIRVSKDGQYAVVIAGTGTGPRDVAHVVVDSITRLGKALRLSKKTYFYQNAVCVRAINDISVRENPPIRCPIALWGPLQALARTGAEVKLSKKDFREWWPEASEVSSPAPSQAAGAPGKPASQK